MAEPIDLVLHAFQEELEKNAGVLSRYAELLKGSRVGPLKAAAGSARENVDAAVRNFVGSRRWGSPEEMLRAARDSKPLNDLGEVFLKARRAKRAESLKVLGTRAGTGGAVGALGYGVHRLAKRKKS